MFRQMFTRVGVPAAVAAAFLMAGPAWAQHHGGGGHGGGFHGGSPHVGSFHSGSFHPGSFHSGSFHPGSFHSGSFHSGTFQPGRFHTGGFHTNSFRGGSFHRGGFYPGYYPSQTYYPSYGYYPPDSYYPSYDFENGSAPEPAYLDSYGDVAPSYSSGYQALEPVSTLNLDAASAQTESVAYVTARVPANAQLWFQGSRTTSTGPVREFQSPPLRPGQYTYEIRARWTEDGRDITQTQKVAISPGAHLTVDFPVGSGTD